MEHATLPSKSEHLKEYLMNRDAEIAITKTISTVHHNYSRQELETLWMKVATTAAKLSAEAKNFGARHPRYLQGIAEMNYLLTKTFRKR